jgi:glutamate dehydrogenase
MFEIWVYSPRVEGVHLRFGKVARGGVRWSDRREDFRVEVLGLVKAQAVKNAVIVPVGAKGGFVLRHPPGPEQGRQALLDEGVAGYRTFIRGMLDVTDNRVTLPDGTAAVRPPDRVVRWDDDDPYLVVAAAKGTATFSDLANAVSAEYGFWLGDAFASGGSAGYDHKAMGITARGAWESVKRHFRTMGRDCQREDVTVVGIGDMSGDVFGNGMLLSRHIRLVAAFDHRHVFLDPDPEAEASFRERERLFGLPRSSWADYDQELISKGGGVWARAAKSVPISSAVRATLGLPDDVEQLTPNEVVSAILRAPVDLLWNGGIGTYVKASTESHADAGDKANDTVRVDAADVRALVVGEGGNLGLTQRARIELARASRHVNTDAIDNSAGVDTSDHEVNLKILLDAAVRDGDLTGKQRDQLLAEMTDEVAALVLRHNYRQNVALDLGIAQAPSLVNVHAAYLRSLERHGHLDRELERLPNERELRERRVAGEGLAAPELAVLLGMTKTRLYAELLETGLPDEPALRPLLHEYFPLPVQERFPERIDTHPLRREIVTTRLANQVIDEAGITFLYRLGMETATATEDLCRAHLVARTVFDLEELTAAIDALDHRVDAGVQTRMRLAIRLVVERAARWFVLHRSTAFDAAWEIEFFDQPVTRVQEALPDLLTGEAARTAQQVVRELTAAGVPADLARRIAVLVWGPATLGIVETSRRLGADLLEVTRAHLAVGERMRLGRLHDRVVALPRDDRWQTMARAALRDELAALHASLTAEVIAMTDAALPPSERVTAWEAQDSHTVRRARTLLSDVLDEESGDLARLSVGLRAVRSVLRGLPAMPVDS